MKKYIYIFLLLLIPRELLAETETYAPYYKTHEDKNNSENIQEYTIDILISDDDLFDDGLYNRNYYDNRVGVQGTSFNMGEDFRMIYTLKTFNVSEFNLYPDICYRIWKPDCEALMDEIYYEQREYMLPGYGNDNRYLGVTNSAFYDAYVDFGLYDLPNVCNWTRNGDGSINYDIFYCYLGYEIDYPFEEKQDLFLTPTPSTTPSLNITSNEILGNPECPVGIFEFNNIEYIFDTHCELIGSNYWTYRNLFRAGYYVLAVIILIKV